MSAATGLRLLGEPVHRFVDDDLHRDALLTVFPAMGIALVLVQLSRGGATAGVVAVIGAVLVSGALDEGDLPPSGRVRAAPRVLGLLLPVVARPGPSPSVSPPSPARRWSPTTEAAVRRS